MEQIRLPLFAVQCPSCFWNDKQIKYTQKETNKKKNTTLEICMESDLEIRNVAGGGHGPYIMMKKGNKNGHVPRGENDRNLGSPDSTHVLIFSGMKPR